MNHIDWDFFCALITLPYFVIIEWNFFFKSSNFLHLSKSVFRFWFQLTIFEFSDLVHTPLYRVFVPKLIFRKPILVIHGSKALLKRNNLIPNTILYLVKQKSYRQKTTKNDRFFVIFDIWRFFLFHISNQSCMIKISNLVCERLTIRQLMA